MKKMKKMLCAVLALLMVLALTACGGSGNTAETPAEESAAETVDTEPAAETAEEPAAEGAVYKVGVCKWVDHASLDQIEASIDSRLSELETELGVTFEVEYQSAMADAAIMDQIITDFIADGVDLMVGIATPVAVAMQAATEDNQIPVVFSAVSDPEASGLVNSNDAPGANITGTSDFLNTPAMLDLIFEADPDADLIALLYDMGQDSSATPIAAAKEYLDAKGVAYKEYTGTNAQEVLLAAQSIVNDEADAVFTPTDNTIQDAELTIYEALAEAGIPHYAGADSFARNGGFLGYGVNYVDLGIETANMIAEVLVNGADTATLSVKTFDNGIATINTETCEAIGFDIDEIEALFAPLCSGFETTTTGDEMEG